MVKQRVYIVTNAKWGYGTEGTYQELAQMWHELGWTGFFEKNEKIFSTTNETIAVVKLDA